MCYKALLTLLIFYTFCHIAIGVLPQICLPDQAQVSKEITTPSNTCPPNRNITVPAPPFPELYAVPGTDTSVFLHVKYAWDEIQRREYTPTSRVIETVLSDLKLRQGDVPMDELGVVRSVGGLEISVAPFYTRLYDIRYSVARASILALGNLYRIYGYFEVEVNIHVWDYDEGRPDGYIIVIRDEESEVGI